MNNKETAVEQIVPTLLAVAFGPLSLHAGIAGLPRGAVSLRLVAAGIVGTFLWLFVAWEVISLVA